MTYEEFNRFMELGKKLVESLLPGAQPEASAQPQPAKATLERDSLLNEHQVEKEYDIAHRWLRQRRLKGGGPPFVRLGPRCIRYRRSDLEEWLDQQTKNSTSEYATT